MDTKFACGFFCNLNSYLNPKDHFLAFHPNQSTTLLAEKFLILYTVYIYIETAQFHINSTRK